MGEPCRVSTLEVLLVLNGYEMGKPQFPADVSENICMHNESDSSVIYQLCVHFEVTMDIQIMNWRELSKLQN